MPLLSYTSKQLDCNKVPSTFSPPFFHDNDISLFLYDPLFVICHNLPWFTDLDEACNEIWWKQDLLFVTSGLHAFINLLVPHQQSTDFLSITKLKPLSWIAEAPNRLYSRSIQPHFSQHLCCSTCAYRKNSPTIVCKCCFVFDIDWSSTTESHFTSSQSSEFLLS